MMKNNVQKYSLVLVVILAAFSCQKIDRPVMGDYEIDKNPPGGPLKFSAPFDGKAVDVVRANFGVDHDVTYVPGLTAEGVKGTGASSSYVSFPSANDFGGFASFTISFWMNVTMAQKDNDHAVGIFAFANTDNFWSNFVFYADNNTKSASDSMDLKMHFNAPNNGDNWNFAGYNFSKAWPKMYDGQWHQVAFTYDATTKIGTVYRDGAVFDQKTAQDIKFEHSSQLVVGGFQQAAGIKGNSESWMAGFPGIIDQVKLYGVALSASDIATSFTNKE